MPLKPGEKGCDNCLNKCMDMDMDPYCAAVNKPYGRVLFRGKPPECGEENKLWETDTRPQRVEVKYGPRPNGDE